MSYDTARTALHYLSDSAPASDSLKIIFFGGEPLLNFPLIRKIVEYTQTDQRLRQNTFHFSITTNGSLFTRQIIRFLNKYEFSVTISIDGDRKIQNLNRPLTNGKNSYRIVRSGINKFLSSRQGRALGRATITTDNIDLQKISFSISKMGFKKFDYVPVTAQRSALYALTDFQYRRLILDLERQAEDILCYHNKKNSASFIRIPAMMQQLKSANKKYFYCGAARNFLAVSISGAMYPCHRFVGLSDWGIGDIKSKRVESRAEIFETAGIANDRCRNCWARHLCGGGCMYDNYVYSGEIHIPDPRNCAEIKRRIEMAIYVIDRLKERV